MTSSAGNTRGLIEAWWASMSMRRGRSCLPRGIPAASLKRHAPELLALDVCRSSAGNTRGLIEAGPLQLAGLHPTRLPRGIPAASLKRIDRRNTQTCKDRLPRGIPAASLKRVGGLGPVVHAGLSSAGNTRGLIEARSRSGTTARWTCVFRGEYPRPHWVFRRKWNTESGGSGTANPGSGTRNPEEVEHRFRRKWNSGSGGRERSSVA